MRTEKRLQHFLPQLWLRKFAAPCTRSKAISVLDLELLVIRKGASLRHQCAESFLYGEDGSVEGVLGDLEGKASKIINEIIQKKAPTPRRDNSSRAILNVFLAAQHGRTPAKAREMERTLKSKYEAIHTFAGPGAASEINLSLHYAEVQALGIAVQSAPVLDDLVDLLVINDSDSEFALSDIGVILHNHWADRTLGPQAHGFGCRGLLIFVPLTPRILLLKYDSDLYYVPESRDFTLTLTDVQNIKALNYLQIACASRNVYFSGHEATGESLMRLLRNAVRISQESRVRTDMLVQKDNANRLLEITYVANRPLALDIPWLKIRRQFERTPLKARNRPTRPSAQRAVSSVIGREDRDIAPIGVSEFVRRK